MGAGIEVQDVTVRFGTVTALKGVSLALESARIHAILGQNGAGKTTMARVIAGLVRPDVGRVEVGGMPLPAGNAHAAAAAGVAMVHQSFTLAPSMTVAEALEATSGRHSATGFYSRRSIRAYWADALDRIGVRASPDARIRDLPVETLQALEVARALHADSRILILDEPTAVLAPPAVEQLFDRVRSLRDAGITVVLILHKLAEVLRIAETVTVLRGGQLVMSPTSSSAVDAQTLSNSMIGMQDRTYAEAPLTSTTQHAVRRAAGRIALRVRALEARADGVEPAIGGVDLDVPATTIVGVAGVEGNGQRQLLRLLAGLEPPVAGTIELDGEGVTSWSTARRRAAGLRVVPFERNSEGVSASTPLWKNWAGGELGSAGLWGRVRPRELRRRAREALEAWHVHYQSVDQLAGSLSGGNIQKLILARELDAGVKVVLAAQPARGLDVQATKFVHDLLRQTSRAGAGVLLISSDLEELFELSHHVVVIFRGELVARFDAPFDRAAVGRAMLGSG